MWDESGSAWSHASRARTCACGGTLLRQYMRDARRARAREIEGPLRQRGGRGVRRLEAWGGGWAREERLSGEPYRVPNACHRTRKRCRVWCTVKRIVAAQSMLHESREKAGQDKEPTSPGEVQDQSVTETSAVTRETGGADLSTVVRVRVVCGHR